MKRSDFRHRTSDGLSARSWSPKPVLLVRSRTVRSPLSWPLDRTTVSPLTNEPGGACGDNCHFVKVFWGIPSTLTGTAIALPGVRRSI
jgi:hypothetical protein